MLICFEIACSFTSLSTHILFFIAKGKSTIKFQVTVNPFGLITDISDAYGGKASDKAIFLNSKVLERCEAGDAVMVDKGYAIHNETQSKGKILFSRYHITFC